MFEKKNSSIIIALLFTFIFIVSGSAVLLVGASTSGPLSYNPALASKFHAPISGIGLAGLSHSPFMPSASGKAFVPAVVSTLADLTPAGSIRFASDNSYILQSETSVAVDPANTNHVVGTFNDGRYFFCSPPTFLQVNPCPSGWTYSLSGFTTSSNGGRTVNKSDDIPGLVVTEHHGGTMFPGSFMLSWGDPSVVAAPNGVFYYASLLIDPFTFANGVMIAVSNSSLWSPGSSCATSQSTPWANGCWKAAFVYGNLSTVANTFEDKELGAVDWSVSSPYYGDLYVTWDHFFSTGTSSSFGARCTAALVCTMISGGGVASVSGLDPFAAFTTPQVGSDGTVYMSWCNYGTFTSFGPVTCKVASSPAGGASFGAPTTVVSFMGASTTFPSYTVVNGYATEQFRTSSIPVIASDGSNANNLYFTIAACTSGFYYAFNNTANTDNPGNCGNSGIIFAKSTNKGATWSTPQVISNPAVNIQPWVTVDSSSGEVIVTYYTTQYDPFNHRMDVVLQTSTNGGTTWATSRITPVSNEPDADPAMYNYLRASGFGGSLLVPQYGDYFQAVALHGSIYILYTGNYVPEQGTYKASPFLAVTPFATTSLQLGDPVTNAPVGASIPFTATGFYPGGTFTLTLNWGGITVPLASGTVASNGVASGSFLVPNVQSQLYTITASDNHGTTASASFGVGQVDLTPVQSSISQLSTTLSSDFASLSGTISTLSATLGTDVTSIQGSISTLSTTLASDVTSIQGSISGLSTTLGTDVQSIQGSLSALNGSMANSFASVKGSLSGLSTQVTAVQNSLTSAQNSLTGASNSITSLGSQLTTVEYLVVVAIVVAAIAMVAALLSMRKR